MSGKQERRFRKLYRPLALGKVDADLEAMMAKCRRVIRRNRLKNGVLAALAAGLAVSLLHVFLEVLR